jgi:hypothetical protein
MLLVLPLGLTEETAPMPPGILNFAGRLAHNHWHLFGESQRTELDSLNRELREADRQLRDAAEDAVRQAAADRSIKAGRRLVKIVWGY